MLTRFYAHPFLCSPVRGKVQAGGDGLDGLVETVEERAAAAPSAVADPVAPRDAEGSGGEFGQDVQPQVLGVQPEFARQLRDHLVLDPAAVVLDVGEQGRLGRHSRHTAPNLPPVRSPAAASGQTTQMRLTHTGRQGMIES
jgi:hypothetical protein